MPVKKKAPAKKTAAKKKVPEKADKPPQKTATKAPKKGAIKLPAVENEIKPMLAEVEHDGPTRECEHCLGTGKCTAGEPYDKGHHQVFGSKVLLTSCHVCLEAAGEHDNSKKLVQCSFCHGSGQVPA